MNRILSFTLLATAVSFSGCGSDEQKSQNPANSPPSKVAQRPSSPEPVAPAVAPAEKADTSSPSADRGRKQYQMFCASCHGMNGAGDGPLAGTLNPKPARHNDGEYMTTLTDDYLFKVIKEGGAAVGKSPMMAPWAAA